MFSPIFCRLGEQLALIHQFLSNPADAFLQESVKIVNGLISVCQFVLVCRQFNHFVDVCCRVCVYVFHNFVNTSKIPVCIRFLITVLSFKHWVKPSQTSIYAFLRAYFSSLNRSKKPHLDRNSFYLDLHIC